MSEGMLSLIVAQIVFRVNKYPSKGDQSDLKTFASLLKVGFTLGLTLWITFSAEDVLKHFFLFSQETGFDISCKLKSPVETICMKYQILLSGKYKKNIIIRLPNLLVAL